MPSCRWVGLRCCQPTARERERSRPHRTRGGSRCCRSHTHAKKHTCTGRPKSSAWKKCTISGADCTGPNRHQSQPTSHKPLTNSKTTRMTARQPRAGIEDEPCCLDPFMRTHQEKGKEGGTPRTPCLCKQCHPSTPKAWEQSPDKMAGRRQHAPACPHRIGPMNLSGR